MGDKDHDLRDVRGWLAFFALTLVVFTPARSLYEMVALWRYQAILVPQGDRWPSILVIDLAAQILVTGAALFAGWRLYFIRVWRSVIFTIVVLWLFWPVTAVVRRVGSWFLEGLPLDSYLTFAFDDVARWTVYPAVWTLYLLRSVRVANTYPRETADEHVAAFE